MLRSVRYALMSMALVLTLFALPGLTGCSSEEDTLPPIGKAGEGPGTPKEQGGGKGDKASGPKALGPGGKSIVP